VTEDIVSVKVIFGVVVELLYRTDFFPGLGWMLERTLWQELEPRWPITYVAGVSVLMIIIIQNRTKERMNNSENMTGLRSSALWFSILRKAG